MIDPTTDLRELPVKFISVGASTNIFAGSDVYNSTCDFLMLDVQRPYELLCTSGVLQTKALHGNQYNHLTLHELVRAGESLSRLHRLPISLLRPLISYQVCLQTACSCQRVRPVRGGRRGHSSSLRASLTAETRPSGPSE